jgi:hypothetical protein
MMWRYSHNTRCADFLTRTGGGCGALAAELGLARYRTELVGRGARQYLVIERYDRGVNGETVT